MYPIGNLTTTFLRRTGTGALETIAHGQNAIPKMVEIHFDVNGKTYTKGVHTKDAVLVTVENAAKYDLVVWW